MSIQVPWPRFIDYFPPFVPWCDSVIVDDACPSTVGNDVSVYSVGENTIVSETGDVFVTVSSDVATLDSASAGDKSVTRSDFAVSMNNDGSIEYDRISSEAGTAEGSSGVC